MKKYVWLLALPMVVFALACGAAPNDTTNTGGGTQVDEVAQATITPTPQAAKPTGPFTAFKAGTYEVGNGAGQVKPGKYKTTVPAGETHCYWARLSNLDGDIDSIIANENLRNAGTPGILNVKASDKAVKVSGDCEWTLSA